MSQFAMIPMDLIKDRGSKEHPITPNVVAVYAVLAGAVNSQDTVAAAWPSTRAVGKQLGINHTTVARAIQTLIHHGWLAEVTEDQWLPRWREAMNGRLQPVRILTLPRHPKQEQTKRNANRRLARGQKKVEVQKEARSAERERQRAALVEYRETGVKPVAMSRYTGVYAMNLQNVDHSTLTDAQIEALLDKVVRQ